MVLSIFQEQPIWDNNISSPSAYSSRFIERLLGLENGDVRYLLLDLESLLTIKDHHASIRFFHASLSDYLFDKSRSGKFWIDAGAVSATLIRQCLFWLLSEQEWKSMYYDSHLSSVHLSVVYIDFPWFFLRQGVLLFSNATPDQGLREAIKTFDMAIGVNNIRLWPVVMHGVRQSVSL